MGRPGERGGSSLPSPRDGCGGWVARGLAHSPCWQVARPVAVSPMTPGSDFWRGGGTGRGGCRWEGTAARPGNLGMAPRAAHTSGPRRPCGGRGGAARSTWDGWSLRPAGGLWDPSSGAQCPFCLQPEPGSAQGKGQERSPSLFRDLAGPGEAPAPGPPHPASLTKTLPCCSKAPWPVPGSLLNE